MNNKHHLIIVLSLFLFSSAMLQAQNRSTLVYTPSDEIFANPERGFSDYQDSKVTTSLAQSLRNQAVTVIQRIYTIPQFNNRALSDDFLQLVQDDLDAAREGGVKLVLRFSYTDYQNGDDAPLDTILLHIQQLTPVLQDNYDVIAYVEAGFIGAWGEWYYSSNNLNNTTDRRTVLYALLDALPAERCVVVRTPNYKRLIFENNNPLTAEEAFNGSRRARTGAHNDCFLASATDYGTYLDSNIEGDKNFLNADNRYLPQGGETCSPSAYSGCANALQDLERMHWSVLNKDYNMDVLNGWVSGGCMDEIKRRLGYRFELQQAVIPDSVKPGGIFRIDFDIKNTGFASPYNERLLEIILRNTADGKTWRLESAADPRFWQSGDSLTETVEGGLPAEISEGNYETLLHLADPIDSLRYRPEYAIRLANENIWEDTTGYNNLGHFLTISTQAAGEIYSGADFFEYFQTKTTPPPPPAEIQIDGQFNDWNDVPQLDMAPDTEESGDALNDAVDLVDMWAANDADNLYISYKLAGNHAGGYFYHIFIDADRDTSTGFHSDGCYAGIDIMVENESIWKYSGVNGAWGWTYLGSATQAWGTAEPSRLETAIDRSLLEQAGAGETIGLLFNVNELDDARLDDYAPNAFTERSYAYTFAATAISDENPPSLPRTMRLRVYPNPFNNRVTIELTAGGKKNLRGSIYDINGRKVKSFSATELASGRLQWDGINELNRAVGSGLYVFRLSNGQTQMVEKLILLK